MKKLKRLIAWARVMLTTRTLKGGHVLFFQHVYLLFNLATTLERIKKSLGVKFRSFLQKKYSREIIIKNSIGVFSVNPKNDSLTKSISSFEYGHQRWLSEAEHQNIFLDIGANIGFYSILAVKQYGFQSAIAFEPNPPTYHRLHKNIELNSLSDTVITNRIGLGEKPALAKLGTKEVHTGGSSFVTSTNKSVDEYLEVSVQTFDNYLLETNLDPAEISFIKIDVEGYEYNVLQGMGDTLKNLNKGTCLFIEIHPHAPAAKETKELIETNGFTLLTSSPQKNFLYKKIR